MSNKGQASAFRNEVLLALHEAGFHEAQRAPEPKVRPGQDRPARGGDILGLPWTVAVRSSKTMDLAGSQDEVSREAEVEGNDLFVSVQSRRDHDVSNAYATMPLSVWLQVLAATKAQPVQQA